jgi:hypothetical protein
MRTDRKGLASISVGGNLELTLGVGFGLSSGFQIDFPSFGDCTPFDIKLTGGVSGRVGLAASAGVTLSGIGSLFGSGSSTGSCGCGGGNKNILGGEMSADLSGYIGYLGATVTAPITKGPDGRMHLGTGNGDVNTALPGVKVGSPGLKLGAGASAGLYANGTFSFGGLISYIGSFF